jgi:hypothetical protein
MAGRQTLVFLLFVPLSVAVITIGCSRTPRSAPPYQIGLAKSDLQTTSNCIIAGLKKSVSDPSITTSVKETKPGKVEEITGTSADAGELYLIRLTAENDGTKAEAFSVFSWSKFNEADLRKPLSACVPSLEHGVQGRGNFTEDRKHDFGN